MPGPFRFIRVLVAIFGVGFCSLAWVGAIFGPRDLFLLGVPAFFAPMMSTLGLPKVAAADSRLPGKERLQLVLERSGVALGLVIVASFVTMCASARLDGVADTPALEQRETYTLNNHGSEMEVSRSRYVLVSASFSTGWVAMVLLFNVSALYRLVFERSLL